MDEYGCGSSVVWDIFSDISLENEFLSVYYWYYLQVGLCALAYYFPDVLDWYLDQIDNL